MIFNFLKFFRKYFCFRSTCIDLLLKNLGTTLKHFYTSVLTNVAYSVSFMISNDALRANHDLVIFTEIFCLLVRVTDAKLNQITWLCRFLFFTTFFFSFNLFHQVFSFFWIETIKNCEVLDELLDVRTEVSTTSGTCKYVARAQVH